MRKVVISMLCMTMIYAPCIAQSKYQNELQPGVSTRTDAIRVLGQPVRTLSATLFEHTPPAGAEKLIVEYRDGSEVIERIESHFIDSFSRDAMLTALNLPTQADARKTNTQGKLVEYFSQGALVLTYSSAEARSGVKSLGYYSQELFERVSGANRTNSRAQNQPLEPSSSTPGPTSSGTGDTVAPRPAASAKELFVPEGTEFTVVTTEKISSKSATEGDRIVLKVDEQVVVKGRVVINRGTTVKGTIVRAEKSGMMGKGGKVAIRVESTTAIDGQEIKLRATQGKEGGSAVASTVALTVLFGPLGLLKKGGEAAMKEGTKIKVYTDEDKQVRTEQ